MVDDLTILLRKHGPVFAGTGAVLAATAVVPAARDDESVLIICSLAGLVLWCSVVAYAGYQVFAALHVADDYLLLSHRRGPRAGVLLLAVALWIQLAVLGVVEVAAWALAARGSSSVGPGGLGYAWAARALSFAAFLAVVVVASLAAKAVRRRLIALVLGLVALTVVTVAVGALDLRLVRLAHPDYLWTLGIDTEFHGFSQYATVLPLAIRPPGAPASPSTTLLPVTLAVNAAVVALCAAAWVPLRRMRINLP